MYFKDSLVQFTTPCMCLWGLKLLFIYITFIIKGPLHPMGTAGSAWPTLTVGTPLSLSMGFWGSTGEPAPLAVPHYIGTLNPIAFSKGTHFAMAKPAPATELSHSHLPSLSPTELLIWFTVPLPYTKIPICTNPGVKGSCAAFYNFTTNSVFKSLFFHCSGQD